MFLHYKRRFQTCLQMLESVRREFPDIRDEVLSYAGVLDPMAEGWVPILVGKDENRNRVVHTEAVKEYFVDILVGVATDSGDLMGIVDTDIQRLLSNDDGAIETLIRKINSFPEMYQQKISKFANKKYKSKPLWWYQLHEQELPEEAYVAREVKILDREVLSFQDLSIELLIDELGTMGEVFGHSFRMERILPSWGKWFGSLELHLRALCMLRVRVVVTKGFFVRQWVQDLSNELNVPLTVWQLRRTKVFG